MKTKSFAVIGMGLFGVELAKTLYEGGHNVLVIDTDEKRIEKIANNATRAVTLDATNRDALAQLGINKYDSVIVAITGDLATSVLITMNLKALDVPQIICKVQSETDREVLETLGASFCITPEQIGAIQLSHRLTTNNIIDFIQLSEHHSIIEMSIPESWIGKSLIKLSIRAKYGVNVIAIRRDNRTTVDFKPDEPLRTGDLLVIVGNNKNLAKLQKVK